MDGNLSISSFRAIFWRYRPLLLAVLLFAGAQLLCLAVSDITQEGSKQVVKQKRIWARAPGTFKREVGKELVVIFGNSAIGAAFVPDVFDKINGYKTRSYNMALIALQLPPHYFLLNDFIKFNGSPDWILLQYGTGGFEVESFPLYAIQGAGFMEVLNYAYYRKNLDVFLNYIIPSRAHWPEVCRYFVGKVLGLMPQKLKDFHKDIYLNKSNANAIYGHNRKHFYASQYLYPEQYREETLNKLQKNRGYYYIVEQAADGGMISKEYFERVKARQARKAGEDEEADKVIDRINGAIAAGKDPSGENFHQPRNFSPFVREFFSLARKHHIKIMIISEYDLSLTGEERTAYDKQIKISPELRQLQKIYKNIYFPPEAKGSLVFGYESFSDPGHVNVQGAQKYTAIIGEEFKALKQSLEK